MLVSRWPGFHFWVFLVSDWVGYMLDHSLMGGSDDAWSGGVMMHGLVELLDRWTTSIMLYYPVCIPSGRGNFLCILRPVLPAQCRATI